MTERTDRDTLPGFPDDEAVLQASERARGVFTAELIESREPERYQHVAAMLAEGSLSQRDIARGLRMSRNSVAAIYKRELAAGRMEPARKQLSGGFALLAATAQERLLEAVQDDGEKISAKDLAIIAAVAVDKHQLLSGGPTEIVEHRDGPNVRNLDSWFDALPRAGVIDGGNGADKRADEVPALQAGDQASAGDPSATAQEAAT